MGEHKLRQAESQAKVEQGFELADLRRRLADAEEALKRLADYTEPNGDYLDHRKAAVGAFVHRLAHAALHPEGAEE